MFCVKGLVESGGLKSVPSKYIHQINFDDCISSEAETIPSIDFARLTSGTPDQRSKVIQDIGNACREWGFFTVTNHGVPEKLRDEIIRESLSFFDLTEEEKLGYAGKKLMDPIRCGTSFNLTVEKTSLWRDYLKIHVHPHFNAPDKPAGFSEILQEYCRRTREMSIELLKGISKSLGLEESYINKAMNLGSDFHQLLVINLYPPCPQPEVAMGLPPHSDHGLLTILLTNDLEGLQILRNGKWVPVNPLPDSFLVNVGDHMEILTNGKYKSIVHRAVVNKNATRISIGTAQGPPLETMVSPAPDLVDCETHPPGYRAIKYREYLELQQNYQLDGKSCLDRIRL